MNIHFDWLAPIYDRVIGERNPEDLREILKLPVAGRLLDAGGGTGRVSSSLRPMVDGVVISDWSKPMLREAHAKGCSALVNGLVETLPFPDESFERVLVVDALHHFPNQVGAIAGLVRVLKPGGRLLIEEPDINLFSVKLIALAEKVALMGSHFHSPTEISAMLSAHGFSPSIHSDGRVSAWIVIDKNQTNNSPYML